MLRIFKHYVSASILFLIIFEFVVLYFSVYLGVELRFFQEGDIGKQSLEPLAPKAMVFAFTIWLSMTAVGLHTRNVVDELAGIIIRIFIAFLLGFLGIVIIFYIYPSLFFGRGVFAFSLIIAFVGIFLTRTIYQKIDNNEIFRRKILVLGTGEKAKILEELKNKALHRGQDIVGYLAIDNNLYQVPEKNVLEVKTTLLDLAQDYAVDEIVLAMDDRRKGFPLSGLLECKMKGIFIRDLVHFLERVA